MLFCFLMGLSLVVTVVVFFFLKLMTVVLLALSFLAFDFYHHLLFFVF